MSTPCAESPQRRPCIERRLTVCVCAATLLSACAAFSGPGTSRPSAAAEPPPAVTVDYRRAQAAMAAGDWPSARTTLQSLVAAHPELPGPAVNLAIVCQRLGDPAQARSLLEKASIQWPNFAPGQLQYGLLLRDLGQFEQADAALMRATEADPNEALAYYHRGVINELYLQKFDVALESYEKFQRLQPVEDKQVGRWMEDLRRRMGKARPASTPAASGGSSS